MTTMPTRPTPLALAWLPLLVALTAMAPRPASAQDSSFSPVGTLPATKPAAWTFTPSLVYSESYDDNVLLRSKNDQPVGDVGTLFSPRGDIGYLGKRGQFDAQYAGGFVLYRTLNTLNNYDQHASLSARRRVSKRVTLFALDSAAMAPTTEAFGLAGVPFVRAGSTLDDLHGGVEMTPTKRTTFTASYNFEWLRFTHDASQATQLIGGHSNGASLTARHQVTSRTALTADYAFQHAVIAEGAEVFNIQNSTVGIDRLLSEHTHIYGAIGISRLDVSDLGPARTGPSYRAGIVREGRAASISAAYERSFVPSYGFGGTTQNEDVAVHLQVPLSRKLDTQTSVAWRRNDPLVGAPASSVNPLFGDQLSLHSWWGEAVLQYSVKPRVRLELFYGGDRQTVGVPGGIIDRNRFGFQIVTFDALRAN